jgi:hypothetical protein
VQKISGRAQKHVSETLRAMRVRDALHALVINGDPLTPRQKTNVWEKKSAKYLY